MKTTSALIAIALAFSLASCASPEAPSDSGHVVFESAAPNSYHSAVAGPRARKVAVAKAERWAHDHRRHAYAVHAPRPGIATTSHLGAPAPNGIIYLD
jgi:hypothetical protein